ncbi:MAG: hypothetical protein WC742_12690 [Gallionellaceae bacterium]
MLLTNRNIASILIPLFISSAAFAADGQTLDDLVVKADKPAVAQQSTQTKTKSSIEAPKVSAVYGRNGKLKAIMICESVEILKVQGDSICGWTISELTSERVVLQKGKNSQVYMVGMPSSSSSSAPVISNGNPSFLPPLPLPQGGF